MARLRLLPWQVGTPARNMALDEALLRTGESATFRTYAWDPPGLSLGYFQEAREFEGVPGRHRLVRRLTGGGAIYHEHELTFSLAADRHLLPAGVADSHALLHDAVAAALEGVGVPVTRLRTGSAPAPRPERPWCFSVPGIHDLVDATGRKLVGSAQRRVALPRRRLLHHGSIVLRRPAPTPFCAAVEDFVDPDSVLHDLCRLLAERFSEALDLHAEPGDWTGEERRVATRLERERYESGAFIRRSRSTAASVGTHGRAALP